MSYEPSREVILYKREDGAPAIEVQLEGDTVWLSQQQMAALFQTTQQDVSLHLRNVYAEGELEEAGTRKDFLLVRHEGTREVRRPVAHYNLDAIISVGYRVKSSSATQFRGRTAAEVIVERADSTKHNMGLTSFAGARPRKSDARVAKNYLSESELKRLNTLVSAYFEAAEFRAQNQEPTRMADWLSHLDRIVTAMEAPVLTGPGTVSHHQAVTLAGEEYSKYRKRQDLTPSPVEEAYLSTIKQTQKKLEERQSCVDDLRGQSRRRPASTIGTLGCMAQPYSGFGSGGCAPTADVRNLSRPAAASVQHHVADRGRGVAA